MKPRTFAGASIVALSFLLPTQAGAQTNLVTDGGFEAGGTGWNGLLGFNNVSTSNPHSGTNSLRQGCVTSPCAATQNISSLTVGRNYTLSFWLKPDGRRPSTFVASFGGVQLLSLTNTAASSYSQYTYVVAPTGTSAALSFDARNDPGYWYLDDVSLVLNGPSVADSLASMQRNSASLRKIFSLQAAYLNPGLNYDCAIFDVKGICVAFSGRYSYTSGSGPEATSGILTLAYRVNENIRLGGFIEQFATDMHADGVSLSNDSPDLGVFGVWSQTETGEGLRFRAAYRYGNNGVSITRDVVGSGEAGRGNSELSAQGFQFTASNGFQINNALLLSPYIGVRYTIIQRNGYTESASGAVTAPLTYAKLRHEATSVLLGVSLLDQVSPAIAVSGSVGMEQDTSRKISDYSATGIPGLTAIAFDQNTRLARATASAGISYKIDKTQQISAQVVYREEAYGSAATTTGMLAYAVGF